MGDIITLRKNAHDEAQELLPWFVNGSLAPDEAKRVEAHRAACAECLSDFGRFFCQLLSQQSSWDARIR